MELPSHIGKYDIVSVIGRGGMGIVYHARDNVLGRPVALKVMTSELAANREVHIRFLREARSVAGLQHANIVVVYELGEHGGSPFIAMEFLEGQTLDHLLRSRSPLTLAEKIDIVLQVARALQYAHHKGVVHRDIKPANIMCMADGSVKVVDFGIAHLTDQTITRTGLVLGTLAYMAPEQLNGEGIDHRSDVFSLGVVLYQLLSGKLPFEGATTAETMMKILLEPPSPLPATGGLDPPGLQIIVDKALAKKKDERYQSCGDFVESLTRLRREFELPLQVAAVDQEKIEASSGRVQREANLSTALIPPTEPTVRQRFGPGITAPPKLATPAQRQPTFSVRLMSRASFVAGAIILMLVVAGLWLYTYVAKQESARNRADAPTNTAVTPKSGSSNPPAASTDAKQHSGEDTKKKAQPSVLNVSPNAVDHSEHKSKAEVADAKTRDAIRAAITEGAWHIDRGEYQQAIQIYQEALKIDPANSELKQKIRAAQSAQEAEQKILKK